jgi:homoaconitase/3-isopropylmalate dehydratase large subunit
VAFGIGTTDMANAFVTGAIRMVMPDVLHVEFNGCLPPGVTAKDLVLHLLADPVIRAGAGVGKVFEFGGNVVHALSTDERATLTNMTADLGGYTGIVEPDDETACGVDGARHEGHRLRRVMHCRQARGFRSLGRSSGLGRRAWTSGSSGRRALSAIRDRGGARLLR